jgi:hypothetical protein
LNQDSSGILVSHNENNFNSLQLEESKNFEAGDLL